MTQQICDVLIIGAGPAGLAAAASLRQAGVDKVTVLEQGKGVGWRWQGHYERLHLHTAKYLSDLPGLRFPRTYPTFPSRLQFVDYLEAYARKFDLTVCFEQEVVRVTRKDATWQLTTQTGACFTGRALVVATGRNNIETRPTLPGETEFQGKVLHSRDYKNAQAFRGQRVLVVGAGNSGAEIALDLVNAGAGVGLSVRSPTHVAPLRSFGLPTQLSNILLSYLPNRSADAFSRLFLRLRYGDLTRYGLPRPDGSPRQQISARGRIPMIDVGTIARIKDGSIEVLPEIKALSPTSVTFRDGRLRSFDAIILATGYRSGLEQLVGADLFECDRFGLPIHTKAENLEVLGFSDSGKGNLFEIRREARQLAQRLAAALRPSPGRFAWRERMGIHQADHRNCVNRLLHLVGIPAIVWGILNIFAQLEIQAFGFTLDLALLLIALVAPVYLATDFVAGTLFVSALLGMWLFLLSPSAVGGVWGNLLLGVGAIAGASLLQIKLGHGHFERHARVDTRENLREAGSSKNPIPILLIIFYHFIEVLFAFGYRRDLRAQVDRYRQQELQKTALEGRLIKSAPQA